MRKGSKSRRNTKNKFKASSKQQEVYEMDQEIKTCDINNMIHSAKFTRIAEAHNAKAQAYMAKVKSEVSHIKSQQNSTKKNGIKHLSRTIGDNKAQPLIMVERDRATQDGGRKGELTSNPKDIDAVVKRAWQAIHNGMAGCIETAVETFLCNYLKYISIAPATQLPRLTGRRVQEAFRKIPDSARAMDGWNPKELSLLSLATCEAIAVMLDQIEQGAPWPRSSMHARVGFLEKGRDTSWQSHQLQAAHDHVAHLQGMGRDETRRYEGLGRQLGIGRDVCRRARQRSC